ncbi:MAG: glycoside hydrolase family 99-like domain-containing protein, partial [Kiritimatiellia bacterium]
MKKLFSRVSVCAAALVAAGVFGAEPARPIDVVAVYYPHWHQYPKGDEWFGPGWNEGEWAFVKTMRPRFPGHKVFKPLPGYLNGKDPADVETEIDLAAGNGITVFLYDYYWYNGQKTQEEAIEQGFLKAKNRGRMKFALMWCYHERVNAFRPPYEKDHAPLMNLAHTPEEFLGLIDYSIAHYFNQPEYWRKDGRLFLSIFNVPYLWETWGRDAGKVKGAFAEARRRVRAAGLGELHLNGQGVSAGNLAQFEELGFDSFTDYAFGAWKVRDFAARWKAGERLFGYEEADGPLQRHWAEMRKGR